jgi:hypothetical protein
MTAVVVLSKLINVWFHAELNGAVRTIAAYAYAQVVRDWAKVVAFVLVKDKGFEGGHVRLHASNKQEVVNVSEDNSSSSLVNKDARVSFNRVEANGGEKALELLIPETRGATEAVQGFVKPSIPTVR